jgi:hypothetical protein
MSDPTLTLGLPHELLLLSLDERGIERANWGSGVEAGLAGGILLELLDRGDLVDDGHHLVPGPGATAPPPGVLGDALAAIRESAKRRDAKGWVQRLPRELRPLHHRVAHDLVDLGIVDEERSKVLGLVPRTRYPEIDPQPEARLRERLRAVLVDGGTPAPHDALLVSLLRPYDMVKGLVDRSERKAAGRRAQEVAAQGAVSGAVSKTVRDAQAAVMAAIVATTVVATTSSD